MKIFLIFLLLATPFFSQITYKNKGNIIISKKDLIITLDSDTNSFISEHNLKYSDFLRLDSERDDKWYNDFKFKIYDKKYYKHSGYDLGHLTPSHITSYDNQLNHNSFSYYNQAPQLYSFNRGKWASLEKSVEDTIKKYKKDVKIITGVIYNNRDKKFLSKSRIKIPISFFKILCISKKTFVWIGSNNNGEIILINIKKLNDLLKLNSSKINFIQN